MTTPASLLLNTYRWQPSASYAKLQDSSGKVFNPVCVYRADPLWSEMSEEIEIHRRWSAVIPERFISQLEICIEQGVFFKVDLGIYVHVNVKYWPLVKYFTGHPFECRNVRPMDFAYSLELYKKSPLHFDVPDKVFKSLQYAEVRKLQPVQTLPKLHNPVYIKP